MTPGHLRRLLELTSLQRSYAERGEARRRLELYEFEVDSHLSALAEIAVEKPLEPIEVSELIEAVRLPVRRPRPSER